MFVKATKLHEYLTIPFRLPKAGIESLSVHLGARGWARLAC